MKVERWDNLTVALRAFNTERGWSKFHTPKNLAMALASEVGELCALFRWRMPEHSESAALDEPTLRSVQDEIGDTLLILLTLCERLGIDPVDAASAKLEANARRYPVETARGRAERPSG